MDNAEEASGRYIMSRTAIASERDNAHDEIVCVKSRTYLVIKRGFGRKVVPGYDVTLLLFYEKVAAYTPHYCEETETSS